MTLTLEQMALYALALLVLFLTPGPVWLALLARGVAGGFAATWPLALGVAVGDTIWPFAALLGVSALASVYTDGLVILRWFGAAVFLVMGIGLLRAPPGGLTENKALTRAGFWPGFAAGLLVIVGNPKAILFYMGVLPGFFDIANAGIADMVVIAALSAIVPLAGNLVLGLSLESVRRLLATPERLQRMNQAAGVLMICVAFLIVLF